MAKQREEEEEEEQIDITTIDPTELNHVPDADDDDDELLFLPTQPEPEAAAGGGGVVSAGGEGDAMDVDAGGRGGKGRGAARSPSRASAGQSCYVRAAGYPSDPIQTRSLQTHAVRYAWPIGRNSQDRQTPTDRHQPPK